MSKTPPPPTCAHDPAPHHSDWRHRISLVLEQIFDDFHAQLVGKRPATESRAGAYLVGERGIHQRVVIDSMIGAVPPHYDLKPSFTELIEEAQRAARTDGQPGKDAADSRPDPRKLVMRVRYHLAKAIADCTGWLAFFYTDAAHRIVRIRFLEPGGDGVVEFTPFPGVNGVFGYGLFSPYRPEVLGGLDGVLLVTTDEFNQLQLQSLCLEVCSDAGRVRGYLSVCAVGDAKSVDHETLRAIDRFPVICYDNGPDDAGFELVRQARETLGVGAFTVPHPHHNLADFIRSFGDDRAGAWRAIRKLIAERNPYPRRYDMVRDRVRDVRQKHGANDRRRDHEIHSAVAELVIADFQERGELYHEQHSAYFFSAVEKQLVPIDRDSNEFQLVIHRYGINPTERVHRYLLQELRLAAIEEGTPTRVHHLAHYDPQTFTLYLFNQDRQIYRISPERIDLVDNGADGVLFVRRSPYQPFAVVDLHGKTQYLHDHLLAKINLAVGPLPVAACRYAVEVWFYALFFDSVMPTKVILAMIGEKGSGKSLTIRSVGKLLFGDSFDVIQPTNDPRDFDAAVTNSAFVAVDNIDRRYAWLEDRLCTVATGGNVARRVYYTTNRLVEFPTRCQLAVTSRTPQFRRDDVADRLLIVRVARLDAFRPEHELLGDVSQHRDLIMSEVAHRIQDIVTALQEHKDVRYSGPFRMADFADFAIKIARYDDREAEMEATLNMFSREQAWFVLEADATARLVVMWAQQNAGVKVENKALRAALASLAEREGIGFPYGDEMRGKDQNQAFAQKMRYLRPKLVDFLEITEQSIGGNRTEYSFAPKHGESRSHETS